MIHLGALVLVLSAGSPEEAPEYTLRVGPIQEDLAQVVLQAEIPEAPETAAAFLTKDGVEVSADAGPLDTGMGKKPFVVVWIAPEIKKGATAEWKLRIGNRKDARPGRITTKKLPDGALEVDIGGKLFTRLIDGPKDRKPYLYPVLIDTVALTRGYPMENLPGEDKDQEHHRSIWFTHGDVNGVDFWSEGPKAGKIVQVDARTTPEDGQDFQVLLPIASMNEWIAPDGKKLLHDWRILFIYDLGAAGRLLDFMIVLLAQDGPVTFGDTKEGTFGIRLAESMKETRGGRILNSRGQAGMKNTWGKSAEWVDYSGPIAGKTWGVAILDHPKSFRHPTTWHVRDYGLFAANPFGLKDFTGDKTKDGSHHLERGGRLTFRYRVYLHPGTPEEAKVAAAWRAYADPPLVRVEKIK